MSNYELMIVHNWGHAHGAGSNPMSPTYANHASKDVRTVYEEGYIMGQADRRRHHHYSAAKFGIKLNEITAQETFKR